MCGSGVCQRRGQTELEHPISEFLSSGILPCSSAFLISWLHFTGSLALFFLFLRPENLWVLSLMPLLLLMLGGLHLAIDKIHLRGEFTCMTPCFIFPPKMCTPHTSLSASVDSPVLLYHVQVLWLFPEE